MEKGLCNSIAASFKFVAVRALSHRLKFYTSLMKADLLRLNYAPVFLNKQHQSANHLLFYK